MRDNRWRGSGRTPESRGGGSQGRIALAALASQGVKRIVRGGPGPEFGRAGSAAADTLPGATGAAVLPAGNQSWSPSKYSQSQLFKTEFPLFSTPFGAAPRQTGHQA